MTDEVYDYQQSQKVRAQAAHRTPISPPRMPSEAENHLKNGVCKTIVLPNLPSVAGRVKYAMGAMNVGQFSQRTGISISYLSQLCNGKAKTLSAFNARRIAGVSEMGVTIGWLLGMPKPEETPPEPPTEPELPVFPDFWARLEWAAKRDGRSFARIEAENKLSRNIISSTLNRKNTPTEKTEKPLRTHLMSMLIGCARVLNRTKKLHEKKLSRRMKQEKRGHKRPQKKKPQRM